jgi:hypothetical protein
MEDSEVWGERILEYTPRQGAPRRIFVRLGRPYTRPGMGGTWHLDIEVKDDNQRLQSHVAGEDSLQVLGFALEHVPRMLARWADGGSLTWGGTPVEVSAT